ncbi:DegT/DnrJ/EryC1/StrS aminotransferase family protein [Delftia acidovorans]|jgi:perosamine synthetase|uniref:DegT/DnrJ/EryC1/StrS family aminotransferase n=1 Tax=Delftia acidovorans TaxID=80866 RepID=UPI002FDEE73B
MIPVYQPYFTGQEKNYVNQCLDSTWISSKGEFIGRFENGFAEYIGVHKATSVNNGTVAIHLALEAIGITAGDEVIVPALTYIASVNTIIQTGATPVYVDSLAHSWQVDPEDILRKITDRTKAVMVVHLYGLACDMDPIVKICREKNLLLIEDCAEGFGSYYKGKHVGTFGDVATFSFFGNKTITTGEGGMVVANDPEVIERAFHLKNQGVSKTREYWHDVVAYNYRMTNICAAIGLAQLEKADEILEKKRQIAIWYEAALEKLPLKFHSELPDTRHSFWMCSIAVNEACERAPLRDYLKSKGVETRPVFYLANSMPHCYTQEQFPVAQSISERGINLPSYPGMSQDEVALVSESISRYFD